MAIEIHGQGVHYDTEKFKDGLPEPIMVAAGDGQLAKLIGLVLKDSPWRDEIYGVIGSSIDNSGGQMADVYYVADLRKAEDLRFPLQAGMVCLDTEFVNIHALSEVPEERRLFPLDGLKFTQNKHLQHAQMQRHGIPMPRIELRIGNYVDWQKAAQKFGYQAVLQTGREAYDGRGTAIIHEPLDLGPAWEKLRDHDNLFVEELVDFEDEYAIQIARGWKGEEVISPLIRTQQVNGQLYYAETVPTADYQVVSDARNLASMVSKVIPGVGLLTVEMFKRKGPLGSNEPNMWFNEVCVGRPHNSLHGSERWQVSQFMQILRLAHQLPPIEYRPRAPYVGLLNLIGTRDGDNVVDGVEDIEGHLPGTLITSYGKTAREGRKIGHISVAASLEGEIKPKLQEVLDLLNQVNDNKFQVHPF